MAYEWDAIEYATQPTSRIILAFQEQANDDNTTEKSIAYV